MLDIYLTFTCIERAQNIGICFLILLIPLKSQIPQNILPLSSESVWWLRLEKLKPQLSLTANINRKSLKCTCFWLSGCLFSGLFVCEAVLHCLVYLKYLAVTNPNYKFKLKGSIAPYKHWNNKQKTIEREHASQHSGNIKLRSNIT